MLGIYHTHASAGDIMDTSSKVQLGEPVTVALAAANSNDGLSDSKTAEVRGRSTVKRLDKIYFLVHGFCYAEMMRKMDAREITPLLEQYLDREKGCAEKWRSRLRALSPTEGLAVFPFSGAPDGPAAAFLDLAVSNLGDRCFIVTGATDRAPKTNGIPRAQATSAEDEATNLWNKEERDMALHSQACSRQFNNMLADRGYAFDPATVAGEAWGASFDGCVTKYTVTLRRMLKLDKNIDINFGLTVPDAAFLLKAADVECVPMDHGVRLFLFKIDRQFVALYTFTTHVVGDRAAWMTLRCDPKQMTVKSKQGIRLWPQPEAYVLQNVPPDSAEPPQQVVKFQDGQLYVPVNAGFVYRLAKAPAYVFAPPGMSYDEFRAILTSAALSTMERK